MSVGCFESTAYQLKNYITPLEGKPLLIINATVSFPLTASRPFDTVWSWSLEKNKWEMTRLLTNAGDSAAIFAHLRVSSFHVTCKWPIFPFSHKIPVCPRCFKYWPHCERKSRCSSLCCCYVINRPRVRFLHFMFNVLNSLNITLAWKKKE